MADGLLIVFSNAKWERLKSKWETECRGNVVGTKCRGMSWENVVGTNVVGTGPGWNVVGMSWGQASVGHPQECRGECRGDECRGDRPRLGIHNVVGTECRGDRPRLGIHESSNCTSFICIRVNSWTTSTLGDRLRLLFEAHWGSTLGDRPRHFASQEAPFHLPAFPNSAHAGARPHARETNRWCTMPCARAQTLRSSASALTAKRLPFPKSR